MTEHSIELLRFSTAGSVDDGKSTLIGRLLHDSKSIFEDQWEALERTADLTGGGEVNLANLTDGLRAEREQGITIDVAYRYFATPKRKFIIADTPGHVQYTRNMVTGASTANMALILIDARNGVIEQTKRHSYIAALVGIPHIVVCINKMDLVDWSEDRFNEIRDDFDSFAPRLGLKDITFIPVSALEGDNVVDSSKNMPWYQGGSLLAHMEDVYISSDVDLKNFRMPVQWVNRPLTDEHRDFRGFSGQVAGGVVRVGDEIRVLPSGLTSKVKTIWHVDGEKEEAFCPMGTTLVLEDEIDISRGDMIVGVDNPPHLEKECHADICWMHEAPLTLGKKYLIKQATSSNVVMFKEIKYRMDINTLEKEDATELGLNDIGRIRFIAQHPVVFDPYTQNRQTGSFIVIDQATNLTVGAGMLHTPPVKVVPEHDGYMI